MRNGGEENKIQERGWIEWQRPLHSFTALAGGGSGGEEKDEVRKNADQKILEFPLH